MVNIICNSGFLKTKEIDQCINLLHRKYQELDFTVIVVSRDEEILKYIPDYDEFKNYEYRDQITGFSCSGSKTIILQPYKVLSENVLKTRHIKEVVKIFQIALLFHEIRHIYQFYHPEKYNKFFEDKKDKISYEAYINDKSEKEANKLSYYMTKFFNNDISMILGINFKWEINSDRELKIL